MEPTTHNPPHPHTMPTTTAVPSRLTSYWDRSCWPLQALYMLLPVLLIYELGTLLHIPEGLEATPRIWAESLVVQGFGLVTTTWGYMPLVLLVLALILWHLQRKDPWAPEWRLLGLMWVEAFLLALPLLMFSIVLFRDPALSQGLTAMIGHAPFLLQHLDYYGQPIESPILITHDWQTRLLSGLGAGIYEELLFRLLALAALDSFFKRLLGMPAQQSLLLAVGLSALLFGLYHFDQHQLHQLIALDMVTWGFLFFYTLAGVYFGLIFVWRGFGIVAGTHALYNVLAVGAYWLSST